MLTARQISQLKKQSLPQHIAVIMDGNGRWAKRKGLKRLEGHRAGAQTIDRLLDSLLALDIPVVSLYAFSTENWRRPKSEVKGLFSLLNEFIVNKRNEMLQKGIRLYVSGDLSKLPKQSRELVTETRDKTKQNKALVANFCLNYGSRDEILRAAHELYKARAYRHQEDDLERIFKRRPSNKEFKKHLYTASLPDVDLLIRTAGERRLSNFLLYQCAYAEFYFTEKCWPEFDEEELVASISDFQNRQRKFGSLDFPVD